VFVWLINDVYNHKCICWFFIKLVLMHSMEHIQFIFCEPLFKKDLNGEGRSSELSGSMTCVWEVITLFISSR
jgi:hypothetical protein